MTEDETLRVAALVAALKAAASALEKATRSFSDAGSDLCDQGPTNEESAAYLAARDARRALADYAAA